LWAFFVLWVFYGSSAYLASARSYGLLLDSAVCLFAEPLIARRRTDFFCLAKRNRGKKRRALQAAGPAELTALLRRCVQTAAGNMKVIHEVGRDACARGGFSKWSREV
jgi:hypothetical protein